MPFFKKKYLFHPCFILVIILSYNSISFASAWNLKKNHYKIITEMNYKFFRTKSDDEDYIFKEDELISSYNYEYGLNDHVTAGLNGFYLFNRSKLTSDLLIDNNYTSKYREDDLKFYLRTKIYDADNFVFSLQPLCNRNILEIRALLGYGFKIKNLDRFFNIEIAYRDIQEKSDEIVIDFAFGSYFNNNWMLINQILTQYKTDSTLKDNTFTYPASFKRKSKNINDNNITILNMFSYRLTLQQKISLVKKINENYSVSLSFSSYMNNKQFLGNGISLSIWFDL